mgnify:CR=1 FL=1
MNTVHSIQVPPDLKGKAKMTRIENGSFTVDDIIATLDNGRELQLMHRWPVRQPRPFAQKKLPDIPLIFAGYIVYAWLFNSAGGSVLVTMLTHAMNNTVSGEWISPWFTGADSVRQSALLAVLWSVAAIVVIALAGPARLTRRPMVDTEMAPQPVAAGD